MAYPPLILANAARMSGIDVDLFFTFWGLDLITKNKVNKLHVATVGNPNMHPWFHISSVVRVLPGMSEAASWMMRREIDKLDFLPVGEFLELVHDSGARLFSRKMSMEMMKLTRDDLVEAVDDVIGAMEFMEYSQDAQVLFV